MRKKILIIEDEKPILDFLIRGLTYEGYQIDTAEDGSQGLALAYDISPDREFHRKTSLISSSVFVVSRVDANQQ